ncbi:beta strand repeat-containing protein, partial [Lacisediminimonas profundi]|uniref:beta strand repeat-containing protein n=1 Tax=Lacisediminimonas profundi TaxID=2603856 RepID=UPI00188430EC
QEVTITEGSVIVDGLGSLSGQLAIRSITQDGATDITIGVGNLSGSIELGGVGAALANGRGAVLLHRDASGSSYAVQAEGDVALIGVSGLSLQANAMQIAWNRMGSAVSQSVETAHGSYQVNLLEDESRLRGDVVADIAGVLHVEGELFLESVSGAVTLSDASTVQVEQLILGGAGIDAAINIGGSGLGASLSGVDLALVISNEQGGAGRRWVTSKASIEEATLAGYTLSDLRSLALDINSAIDTATSALDTAGAAVIDWSQDARTITLDETSSVVLDALGGRFEIPVDGALTLGGATLGGNFKLTLEQDEAGARSWRVDATGVQISMEAGGAYIGIEDGSGSLLIAADGTRSGSITGRAVVDGLAGVSLSGDFTTAFDGAGGLVFGGTDVQLAVDGFGRIGGDFAVSRSNEQVVIGAAGVNAQFGDGANGVQVANASLALVIAGNGAAAGAGYALSAEGNASLTGFGTVTLDAAAQVRINTLGRAITQMVDTGAGSVTLEFADGATVQELTITEGSVIVDGLGSLSGQLAIRSITQDGATDITIGVDNLSGSIELGGVGATLANGRGAVLLHRDASGSSYAVQAEGDVALTGVSGLSLQANAMQIAWNRMGSAVSQSVETATGSYQVNLLADESRLRGDVVADIAGVLHVDGELFLESVSGEVTLSDASTVQVEQLILGGAGIDAAINIGGSGLGASLSGVDLALVISNEQGGAGRRWVTSKASIEEATLAGYMLSDLRSLALDINSAINAAGNALDTAGAAVIDWSESARTITLDEASSVVLDALGGRFEIPVDGALTLGGATMGGDFKLTVEQDEAGARSWRVDATGVQISMEAGGAYVGIEDGSGTLLIAADGTRSGSITGRAVVDGLAGVSLSGDFTTAFDGAGG